MIFDVTSLVVNTFPYLAFIATAYYAFVANKKKKKTNKHSTEKTEK